MPNPAGRDQPWLKIYTCYNVLAMKHFLKALTLFVVMIALGLAGVYLVNTYGKAEAPQANTSENLP